MDEGGISRYHKIDSRKSVRGQAALEYLITYSWAILLLVMLVSFLYFYVVVPKAITPSSCNFAIGLYCDDIILGSNLTTHATTLALLLTNEQPYPIENPFIFANVNGTNTSYSRCNPQFVAAGGEITCELPLNTQTRLGDFMGGRLYINASYCGFAQNQTSPLECSAVPFETYVGQFSSHAQAQVKLGTSINLTGSNIGSVPVNTSVTLYATVDLMGYPLKGATVNFTENSTTSKLSQRFVTTNPSGVAEDFITSTSPLTVNVIAEYAGYNASYLINFIAPTVSSTTSTTTTITGSSSSSTIGPPSTTSTIPQCGVKYCNVVPLCIVNPKCPNTESGATPGVACVWYECVPP